MSFKSGQLATLPSHNTTTGRACSLPDTAAASPPWQWGVDCWRRAQLSVDVVEGPLFWRISWARICSFSRSAGPAGAAHSTWRGGSQARAGWMQQPAVCRSHKLLSAPEQRVLWLSWQAPGSCRVERHGRKAGSPSFCSCSASGLPASPSSLAAASGSEAAAAARAARSLARCAATDCRAQRWGQGGRRFRHAGPGPEGHPLGRCWRAAQAPPSGSGCW